MQQTPGFGRHLFLGTAVATHEGRMDEAHPRSEAKMGGDSNDDFFGVEDLLDQAYEDAVYTTLSP